MLNVLIFIGCISMALSVGLGAFGAHGLEKRLTEHYLKIYQTGVQYQMIHSIGIIFVGILGGKLPLSGLIQASGWCFIVGIILFSGSLYVLSITGISKLGMITPFGGLAFIIGWILLGVGMLRG